MSPLPERMEDRWADRADTAPGEGTLYWHALLHGYPEVQELAAVARERLSGFGGLHFTPDRWLHMTTLLVGPRSAYSVDQIAEMTGKVTGALASMDPVPVELGRVLYHPEAVMLGLVPRAALLPLHLAVRDASGVASPAEETWVPHATVAYSTAVQPAGPLIEALGMQLPARSFLLRSVSLVVQWGPEREWEWEPIATVSLAGG